MAGVGRASSSGNQIKHHAERKPLQTQLLVIVRVGGLLKMVRKLTRRHVSFFFFLGCMGGAYVYSPVSRFLHVFEALVVRSMRGQGSGWVQVVLFWTERFSGSCISSISSNG